MINAKTWPVAVVILGLSQPIFADEARASCVDEPESLVAEQLITSTIRSDQEEARERYGLYHEKCDGGLYLINNKTQKRITRVNPGWWFEDVISARWTKENDADQIEVIANFITGIGPTGVKPFPARFLLTPTSDGSFNTTVDEEFSSNWIEVDRNHWGVESAETLIGLMQPILSQKAESLEDQSDINIHLTRHGRDNAHILAISHELPRATPRGAAVILVERTRFLDDSQSGDRHYAIASFNEAEGRWQLEMIWKQYQCARGADAGKWTGKLCV